MVIVKIIKNRIYSDYMMKSRLNEYDNILKKLNENGYEHITFRDYSIKFRINTLDKKKYFINRHDVDTDIETAKEFFKIEKKYNVKASYYFRLSTLDYSFMNEIEKYGSEASYHFEEIAQYCKDHNIRSKEGVFNNMENIKEIFISNFKMIESNLSTTKLKTVCSHGDFVNRKLKILNNEITKDKCIRNLLEIDCETYDKDIMDSFNIYVSDSAYPKYYKPNNIFDYIGKKNIICMLTHPRHWRTNIYINMKDNLYRLYEGFKWKLK